MPAPKYPTKQEFEQLCERLESLEAKLDYVNARLHDTESKLGWVTLPLRKRISIHLLLFKIRAIMKWNHLIRFLSS